jgi:hypothetical protein
VVLGEIKGRGEPVTPATDDRASIHGRPIIEDGRSLPRWARTVGATSGKVTIPVWRVEADVRVPPARKPGPRATATMPAPLSTVVIGGPVQGLRVSAGMTHLQSNRGKAATKPTPLGRSSCSPPV